MGAPDILNEPLFAPPMRRGLWSEEEVAALRRLYPEHGGVGCVPLLNRPLGAIYVKARTLGLQAPRDAARSNLRKRVPEHVDAQIRAFYTRGGPVTRGELTEFCARLGRTRQSVRDRALLLGLAVPRYKEPNWTADEDAIVREWAHLVPRRVQLKLNEAGYTRSAAAVAIRMKRIEADRTNYDGYSARQLAELLGVDTKTVTRWIERGLRATRRGTARTDAQHGDEWVITPRSFRMLVKDNVAEYAKHSRKADPFWLLETLTGAHG